MQCSRRIFLRFIAIAILAYVFTATPFHAFAQASFDKSEFVTRREKLFKQIPDGIAVIFAAKEQIYPLKFRQSPDFYYLTGIEEPDAVLVLVGKNQRALLFARKRSDYEVRIQGPGIWQVDKREEIYGLTAVQPLEDFLIQLSGLALQAKRLYLPLTSQDNIQNSRREIETHDLKYVAHPIYRNIPEIKQAISFLHQLAPQLELEDINPLLDKMRWVKSPYEISRMRKSGQIGAEGVKEAMKGTRPGMYEYELEAAARFIYTKLGARGEAFPPIVASGPNTITWHYITNNRRMQAGEIVYMDYGSDYDYYTSDITRTWPVSGRFTPEQEKMYRCILDARNTVMAAMKPGVSLKSLKDLAEEVYKKHGFQKEFLALNRYIGHYVGISVHDVGSYFDQSQPFEPGVVFNVEPLLEFRDQKTHLRLEDTVLITETGAENLTAGVPAELEEIYALIRQKGLSLNK
ncbi:Xaa-Pro peptidase family protein [candidate division KSB1 bacterium]|nr:Xaa-Pro peptidase family protein [candidate division KSB1 bacterium]